MYGDLYDDVMSLDCMVSSFDQLCLDPNGMWRNMFIPPPPCKKFAPLKGVIMNFWQHRSLQDIVWEDQSKLGPYCSKGTLSDLVVSSASAPSLLPCLACRLPHVILRAGRRLRACAIRRRRVWVSTGILRGSCLMDVQVPCSKTRRRKRACLPKSGAGRSYPLGGLLD